MRRRNKTGGKEGKTQRPKTLKRDNAPKTARRRNFSAAGPQEQISALTRELKEALEQQTATSEVLKVISSSPAQLEPVFQAILANAVRICEAKFGIMFLYENSEFQPTALLNASEDLADFLWRRGPFKANPGTPLDRILKTKGVIFTADAIHISIGTRRTQLISVMSCRGSNTNFNGNYGYGFMSGYSNSFGSASVVRAPTVAAAATVIMFHANEPDAQGAFDAAQVLQQYSQ